MQIDTYRWNFFIRYNNNNEVGNFSFFLLISKVKHCLLYQQIKTYRYLILNLITNNIIVNEEISSFLSQLIILIRYE
jgi:hypothetical protein